MDSEFNVAKVVEIPRLAGPELKKLEQELAREFRTVSKQYLSARMVRVQKILTNIDQYIDMFRKNEATWNDTYKSQMDIINAIRTNEDGICHDHQKLASRLRHLSNNVSSPFTMDTIFSSDAVNDNLPFRHRFDKMIATSANELTATVNENRHQVQLIDQNTQAHREIIWRKYQRRLINYKYYLIDKQLSKLSSLYKSTHSLQDSKILQQNSDYYHRSITSINDLKNEDSHDNYYQIQNPHIHKNRVELTNIKMGILKRQRDFDNAQVVAGKRVKLSYCEGLSRDEIDSDLTSIRFFSNNKDKFIKQDLAIRGDKALEHEEVHDEEEVEDDNAEDEDDEVYEAEVNESNDDSEHPRTPRDADAANEIQQKYRHLLSIRSDDYQEQLTIPELPPLGKFPLRNP